MADEQDKVQDIPPTTEGPGEPDFNPEFQGDQNTAHTAEGEGHPAGDGERSTRDIGGPTSAEGAQGGEATGGAKGDITTRGFEDDPHS